MSVVIINTGCSNLSSVQYAVRRLGYNVCISDTIHDIKIAQKIFLPGIGTASSVMDVLRKKNLLSFFGSTNQPILGICLGMQLLAKYSYEGGKCTLLFDKIPVSIEKLPNISCVIPHIGWNQVHYVGQQNLFKNIDNDTQFYFLHSYYMCANKYMIASSTHGVHFCAAVAIKNFFGVQFHPEKSGIPGEQLIKNFLEI